MSEKDCLKYEESVVKTIESCLTAQAMIDINAKHLEGLRTECAITAELTQNEIRALEVTLLQIKTYNYWNAFADKTGETLQQTISGQKQVKRK